MNLIKVSDNGLVVFESTAKEFDELTQEINTFSADVILVERSNPFAGEDSLAKLLMSYPKLLVIVINEEDNWLHTYRREDVLMTSTADLISAIQSI